MNSKSNGNAAIPRLVFEGGFDERATDEAEARGYCAGVYVQFDDGRRYDVVFYDVVRLAQDLETEVDAGNPFIGEPGLIVVADVTLANMQAAVAKLSRENFFESFVPSAGPLGDNAVAATTTQKT